MGWVGKGRQVRNGVDAIELHINPGVCQMLRCQPEELSLLEHDVCPILGIGLVAFLRQQALSRNTHLSISCQSQVDGRTF